MSERLKKSPKQHVNGEKRMVATNVTMFQETTKDPQVEGSRSYQSSVTPLFRVTKVPETLVYCVSVQSDTGG